MASLIETAEVAVITKMLERIVNQTCFIDLIISGVNIGSQLDFVTNY
tara:strand:+ start:2910 stop:3050 length:141 start_codon:yes stop_codon:yes gene_type:complete